MQFDLICNYAEGLLHLSALNHGMDDTLCIRELTVPDFDLPERKRKPHALTYPSRLPARGRARRVSRAEVGL